MQQLLVVCGPTASGKSKTGVLLAEALGGEIISADSMQVYRGLDIGTDKAPAELLARVPHHMISIVGLEEGYSAARYEREAGAIADKLLAENKVPIIVGGSGLYIRILINGIFPSAPASASVREGLKKEAREKGAPALFERLRTVDSEYARVISPGDLRRIVRALEVFELTGAPFSSWHSKHKAEHEPRRAFIVGLRRERDDLYRRIDARVDEMFAGGLVDEVEELCRNGFSDSLAHLRPLGYKEVLDYLAGRTDLDEAVRLTKRNSRRYAKRQMTWFAKEKVVWIDLASGDEAAAAAERILAVLCEEIR
jgi:tRNA dimethylallyltransferase